MNISKIMVLLLLAVVLATPTVSSLSLPGVRPCGVDRWAVKTLSDPAAGKVNFNPQWTTIASLTDEKSPLSSKGPLPQNRLSPLEFKTFQVKALLIGYKLESDKDFHVVIADPNDRGRTMVAEIPDPQCNGANASKYAERYQAARSAVIHLLGSAQPGQFKAGNNVAITITGVGFFDAVRGQTGAAKNGVELHPVLSIQ